jgi:hypothetical protein
MDKMRAPYNKKKKVIFVVVPGHNVQKTRTRPQQIRRLTRTRPQQISVFSGIMSFLFDDMNSIIGGCYMF